jgi:hypothetical protein
MTPKQRRRLAVTDPAAFRALIRSARKRDLAARHLLLHPEDVIKASPEDLKALEEYVRERGWKSLYCHDRRMYKLLRAGAAKVRGYLPIPGSL